MSNKVKTVIKASYMDDFNCIGPECEDNCCYSWNIQVDDDTYEKYKNYKGNEELENLFDIGIIKKNDKHLMKLDEDKNCMFLDEDSLCKIHKKLGGDMLCFTCRTYPRTEKVINTELHYGAYVSCPEIARLALLSKDGIYFLLAEIEIDMESSFNIHVNLKRYYDIIRNLTFSILKNRNYTIEARLFILGFLFDKLDKNINAITMDYIQEIIKDFTSYEKLNILSKSFYNIKPNIKYQHNYYKSLLLNILGDKINKKEEDIEKGFMNFYLSYKEIREESGIEKYEKHIDKYKSLICEYEYILENYLVNYAFLKCTPFSEYTDLKSGYANLLTTYFLLRSTLAILLTEENTCESMFIEVICKFERIINHGRVAEKLLDLIKKDNRFELSHCILILNI